MIKAFRYINLSFFIFMICINALANILPLGHGNTGMISNNYPNLFTPAPITFSIWGVIYILVTIFIIYQLGLFSNSNLANNMVELIGPWFIISCIMNIGWLFSWHYEFIWLSMIFMLGLLFSLIIIVTRFSPTVYERKVGLSSTSFLVKLCFYTFDLYLGWITAATIANASVLLVKIKWNRFTLSEQFWTIVMLIVAAVIGVIFVVYPRRYMSAIALIWAFCGIMIKHVSQSGYRGNYPSIITVSTICIIAVVSAIIIQLIQDINTIT